MQVKRAEKPNLTQKSWAYCGAMEGNDQGAGVLVMPRANGEHSEAMSEIGRRVRERRNRLGMSQKELADEAGVNRDTVGAIEAGKGFRQRKLVAIETVLERLEEEMGIHAPPLQHSHLPAATGALPACETCGRIIWPDRVELFFDVLGAYMLTLNDEDQEQAMSDITRDVLSRRLGRRA